MPGLRWTVPTRADDGAWLELLAAIEAVDQRGETYGPDDLDDEWASVWADPGRDATFVWDGDELIAFAWCKAMPGEQDDHHVECWGGVRPDRRRQGIGGVVLDWQLARGRALAAAFPVDRATRIGLGALDHHTGLLALARSRGLAVVRRFLDLVRPTSTPAPVMPIPPDLVLVDWHDDLDDRVRRAHAEAFAEHWGSEPRTVEQWRQWYTGHRGFRPDLSVVALDDHEVAGFVLAAAYPLDWHATPREAWITSVGVRPDWRKRGIARWLLADVLARIAASDTRFDRAILGVDDANPTGALRVYRDLGFVEERTVLSLAVVVPSGGAG